MLHAYAVRVVFPISLYLSLSHLHAVPLFFVSPFYWRCLISYQINCVCIKTENLHLVFFCALRQFCWWFLYSLHCYCAIHLISFPWLFFLLFLPNVRCCCCCWLNIRSVVFIFRSFLRFVRRWQIRILKVEPIYINSSCLLSRLKDSVSVCILFAIELWRYIKIFFLVEASYISWESVYVYTIHGMYLFIRTTNVYNKRRTRLHKR